MVKEKVADFSKNNDISNVHNDNKKNNNEINYINNQKISFDDKIIKEFKEIDKRLRMLKRGKTELNDAILDIYDAKDRRDALDYEEAIDNLHYFDEQANVDSEIFYLAKRRFLCLGIGV